MMYSENVLHDVAAANTSFFLFGHTISLYQTLRMMQIPNLRLNFLEESF